MFNWIVYVLESNFNWFKETHAYFETCLIHFHWNPLKSIMSFLWTLCKFFSGDKSAGPDVVYMFCDF